MYDVKLDIQLLLYRQITFNLNILQLMGMKTRIRNKFAFHVASLCSYKHN